MINLFFNVLQQYMDHVKYILECLGFEEEEFSTKLNTYYKLLNTELCQQ